MSSSPDPRETESIRRDAWRIQLFHEQIAEEREARRRVAAVRSAVFAGVLLGIVGSVAFYI